ncbi:pseudouridine synthase [Rhodocyclaceae bacterium SMB388]
MLALNKPFGVLCQFSEDGIHPTLMRFVPIQNVYPAGRLDTDSEGLLLLTADGALQHRITDPKHKLPKTYVVQVEGEPDENALQKLRSGLNIGNFHTLPCEVRRIAEPDWLWPRDLPVRFRKSVPTSWLEIVLREGKNRQVRRMTAAVGYPTLRLIRTAIGPWSLDGLAPGEWRWAEVPASLAVAAKPKTGTSPDSVAARRKRSVKNSDTRSRTRSLTPRRRAG